MSEKSRVIEYPQLETIDLSNIELQEDLIQKGVAVGVPGTTLIFTQAVELIAGKGDKEDGNK